MPHSLLIEGGTVVTLGKTSKVLPNHSVLVENGRIRRIAPKGRSEPFAGQRIDAARKVVMPGLINAHTHLYSTFARGLTRTKPARKFNEVLKHLWWRLDSALTVEDCYYSALVALLDSIRHGTTTIFDHHASPQAVGGSLAAIEQAVSQVGLRACLCYEVSDRDGQRVARAGLEENRSFISHCRKQSHGHLRALFGLHASFTLSNRTLESAAHLAHESATGFHIHVAEAASDQAFARRKFGLPVVNRLAKFGILGPQTVAAHCVHVAPAEMDLLADTQTAVVHNPQSNMNNAVGVADLVGLCRRGVLVGLGSDAMTTNMLEELRVALWGQRLSQGNPSAGFAEVTAALLANNPRIARRTFDLPLGELAEGGVADVAIFDYDSPTPMESANAFSHLLFGISQAVVDTTIVGGRVLMQNRQLKLDIDEARVHARARELAKALWEQM